MSQDTQNQELDNEVITLVDEDGTSHDFQIVDVLEVEGKEYALLLPDGETDEEEDEVLVLRIEEDRMELIEDEAEFQKVVAAIQEMADDLEEEA